jgi:hypothetical protein
MRSSENARSKLEFWVPVSWFLYCRLSAFVVQIATGAGGSPASTGGLCVNPASPSLFEPKVKTSVAKDVEAPVISAATLNAAMVDLLVVFMGLLSMMWFF